MASSSETMGSSPSWEDSPPSSVDSKQRGKVRDWTQFELATVCALICQHEHRVPHKDRLKTRFRRRRTGGNGTDYARDWVLRFATMLNEAVHGVHGYKNNIPVDDVRELMDFIETKNKAVVAYIERQSAPFRVTRSKKYAFQRLCNNFNDAFYKWTITRRKRLRDPNRRSSWVNHDLPGETNYNNLSAASRAQINAESFANAERGNISDSVYAQRSGEAVNTTTSAPEARSSRYPVLPVKPVAPPYRQNYYRSTTLPPPPPPPPTTHYEQMIHQPYTSYGMERHEMTETQRVYHGRPGSTPSSTWYHPPASPAFFGHDNLRQSIHPMGPTPNTPMATASPAYQYNSELYQSGQQPVTPGSLAPPMNNDPYTPFYEHYNYPEPPQNGSKYSYNGVTETPISPCSPMHMSGVASTEMMGAQAGAPEPVEDAYGTHYTNDDFYPQVQYY
ncbi:hypothetical protein GGS24DRAFT_495612 [Hypoxylon argillaceum]|nr:hypothetical protein GGS24DRAFT_495612 [Hypoxylon argillaceum]